ncbi:MAG: hypothetical protein IKU08_06540 [Clostridia bacterium]|nr:hypothetical protein [Clostridia bacterium]
MKPIKKIEILNSEDEFSKIIDKLGFDKCACTVDCGDKSEHKIRLVFYSDDDLFEEITESLTLSEFGFVAFGGRDKMQYYIAIEIEI